MRFSMKTIPTREAVGTVLCQDITQIIPGKVKGPVFRKGHVVTEADIPVLLSVGKENLYVYEPGPGMVHENDAAHRIAACCAGANLECRGPKEGRMDFVAECDGLLSVDAERQLLVNSLGEITFATLPTNVRVSRGQTVGASRVTPLIVEERVLLELEKAITSPILSVTPFSKPLVGIATTGSEILSGRIDDGFGPVLRRKFAEFGCPMAEQKFTGDDTDRIVEAVRDFVAQGCGMVCVTGGMSVDPDDATPGAIARTGAEVVCYGSPVYPGAMFMLAYLEGPRGDVPVLGLPGGVMYCKVSVFDLVVPRLLAGQRLAARDIHLLGHGGYLTDLVSPPYTNFKPATI